jgi:hypothetical protein
MSDIDIAVKGAKKIEAFLVTNFGAVGRGLHDKLSSVENRIPPKLQKQIRFVASVRNAVVHEEGENLMRNPIAYETTVDQILHGLNEVHGLAIQKPAALASDHETVRSSGKLTGWLIQKLCYRNLIPWFFAIGTIIGFLEALEHRYTILPSTGLGLLAGAIFATLSRLICYLTILWIIGFFLIIIYYLVNA